MGKKAPHHRGQTVVASPSGRVEWLMASHLRPLRRVRHAACGMQRCGLVALWPCAPLERLEATEVTGNLGTYRLAGGQSSRPPPFRHTFTASPTLKGRSMAPRPLGKMWGTEWLGAWESGGFSRCAWGRWAMDVDGGGDDSDKGLGQGRGRCDAAYGTLSFLPSPASVHLQAAVDQWWLGREWRSITLLLLLLLRASDPRWPRTGDPIILRLLPRCGHGDMRNMAGDVSSF